MAKALTGPAGFPVARSRLSLDALVELLPGIPEDGAVPEDGDAPGNVAIVARAY